MKVALIGCGYWGKNYVSTIKKSKVMELVWICDPKPSLKKKDCPSSCKLTANYSDILEDHQVRGIIIATPPKTHYELARKALMSGKHVLIEKPMVDNSAKARSLIKISKDRSLILMVGHLYLYHPAITKIKKLLASGELGQVRYIYSRRSAFGPIRENLGVLWNLSPHDISIANYLTRRTPIAVSTNRAGLATDKDKDPWAAEIILDYGAGLKSFSHLSLLEPKKTREITIVGSKKTLIFDDLSDNQLKIFDASTNTEKTIRIKKITPLEDQCQHFFDCVKDNKTPLTDGQNGLENVLIIESLLKSQRKQK
ncbi:hypothetical protein BK006_01730 [bacterium CG10_49_38]|nr:MAG: hypothetical protein BK006_01730 [bacterium CG10_49_38]